MNNKENKDLFEQLVKSKLADYNAEVPVLGWEKLENSLLATQKAKVVRKRWIFSSLSAAAAILIGVFFVFQNMKNETPMNVSEHQTTEIELITKEKPSETIATEEKSTKSKTPTQALIVDNSSAIMQDENLNSYSTTQKAKTSNVIISNEKEIATSPIVDEPHTNDKNNDVDEETKQQLIEDFINQGRRTLTSTEDETTKSKKRSRKSISLTAQSGLSTSQQTGNTPTTLRSSLNDTYASYTTVKMQAFNKEEMATPESEINHMQPVSFAALTSFGLTRKLQIETGLVYTYLSSKTNNKSNGYNESEKMQFHYLGIPLNLNYTLFSINKLDMFATVGAMIEKDINGKIKYNDEGEITNLNSKHTSNKSSKINQKNPQFSVSSGVGITYPLYDKVNLYGKIGGRYYINAKNEYRNYYSDEKIGMDIQIGINFNF